MSQSSLVSGWVTRFTDPFAVLGIAVTADDRRVQKRYRMVAMRLHPDRFIDADEPTKDLTIKLLSRLVNPAYEKLRQDKERKENLALLRLQVRRLTREKPLEPQSDIARQLMERPVANVDVFYEQAIVELAEAQFVPHQNFASVTEQLMELNLVYLQLKMGDLGGGVQEKRTGLIAANQAKPIQFAPAPTDPQVATESYDQRHYRRAQEYAKKGAWTQVVQELRDAIKIKADKSEYHSLLGVAYLYLEKPLPGMAKVHLKRALELNPSDTYGVKFGPKLGLVVSAPTPPPTNGKQSTNGTKASHQPTKRGGLFGLFGRK
ncbi:MAG: DnaJ domain-containing protein [Leptolyngbyaceae cyanobacterium bins.302]|nr:DnaJ domain-containing protein [Leptolyngbyaceae cyanobacterium bins.302]